MRDLIDGLMDS